MVDQYQSKPKAVFQKCDVSSWKDLNDAFEAAIEHFGQIDIVCPGAGVFEPPFSNFWIPPGTGASRDSKTGDRYALMDINLTHPIRVTQMAISYFLNASPPSSTSDPKSIIHISSIAGEGVSLPVPLYHASKWGVFGFVKSMANLQDLHGIRVACVMPGIVKTPLWLDHPDKRQILVSDGEAENWVYPQDVAKVMLALVKDNEMDTKIRTGGGPKVSFQGGSSIEVLCDFIRDVPLHNNPGPHASGAAGASLSDGTKLYKETLEALKPGWGT